MTNMTDLAPSDPLASPPADPAAPPVSPAGSPLLRLHLALQGRYLWAILLAIILGLGGACGGYLGAPAKFRSVGVVHIKPYIPSVLYHNDQNGIMPMFEGFVGLQVSLLQSERVANLAIQSPDWQALGSKPADDPTAAFLANLEVMHARNEELITVAYMDSDPKTAAVAVRSLLRAYQKIAGENDVESDTQRLQTLEELRTSLTNQLRGLNDRILGIANEFGSDALEHRYQFKMDELNKLESQLREAELARTLAETKAGVSPASTAPGTTTGPTTAAAPVASSVPTTTLEAPALTPEAVAVDDPRMRDYLHEKLRLESLIEDLRTRFGENHRETRTARSSLKSIENQIAAEMEFAPHATPNNGGVGSTNSLSHQSLAQLRDQERSVRALYDRALAEALDLGRKDLQIKNLKQETDAVQRRLDETKTRLEQLNVESTVSGRIRVLSYGDKAQPYKNKRIPLTVAGGLGGAMLGMGLIALWGFMDRRVKSLGAIRNQLGSSVQMLGVLPLLPDDLSDPAQASMAAYCVHHIRTLLEIGPARAGGRVMAVTSPEARDGKTSLSLALGMSFAASNSKTLLIDCDIIGGGLTARLNAIIRRRIGQILRHRGLLTEPQLAEALTRAHAAHRRIGDVLVELGYVIPDDLQEALCAQKESLVGLLEVLDGEPLAQCIASAGTPGLFILPLGSAAAHHAGQISPRALRRFLGEARQHFDIVLADTGPILGSLEASIVASEADEVILTVSRGQQRQLVDRAVDHLRFINSHVAGLVFNRASPNDVLSAGYSSSATSQSMRISQEGAVRANGSAKAAAATLRLGPVASAVASSTLPADDN